MMMVMVLPTLKMRRPTSANKTIPQTHHCVLCPGLKQRARDACSLRSSDVTGRLSSCLDLPSMVDCDLSHTNLSPLWCFSQSVYHSNRMELGSLGDTVCP